MKGLIIRSARPKIGKPSKSRSFHLKMLNVKEWSAQIIFTFFILRVRQVAQRGLLETKEGQPLHFNGPWIISWVLISEMFTSPPVILDGLLVTVLQFTDRYWGGRRQFYIKENRQFPIQEQYGQLLKNTKSMDFTPAPLAWELSEERTTMVSGSENMTFLLYITFLWLDKDVIFQHMNGSEHILGFWLMIIIGKQSVGGLSVAITKTYTLSLQKQAVLLNQLLDSRLRSSTNKINLSVLVNLVNIFTNFRKSLY